MGLAPSEFELWKDAQGNVQHGYGTPYVASSDTAEALREHVVAILREREHAAALLEGLSEPPRARPQF